MMYGLCAVPEAQSCSAADPRTTRITDSDAFCSAAAASSGSQPVMSMQSTSP